MTNDTTPVPAPAADAVGRAKRGKAHRAANEAAIKSFRDDLSTWIREDRDALIAENASLRAECERLRADRDGWKACADESQTAFEAEALCSMDLRRECERLQGAMPDAGLLDSAAIAVGLPPKSAARADVVGFARELRESAARIRTALVATPQPAEAGTGEAGQ